MHLSNVGLSIAVSGHEDEFPILARALKTSKAAHDIRASWLVGSQRDLYRTTWFNWTSIFRKPFGVSSTALCASYPWEKFAAQQLVEHLRTIEQTLEHSRLEQRTIWQVDEEGRLYPVVTRQMGGTRFYLGRDLNEFDVVELRVLRDTVLIDRTGPDVDGREAEWLTELTLVVIPKESA